MAVPLPAPRQVPKADPERKLRRLRRRFARVARKLEWRDRRLRLRLRAAEAARPPLVVGLIAGPAWRRRS